MTFYTKYSAKHWLLKRYLCLSPMACKTSLASALLVCAAVPFVLCALMLYVNRGRKMIGRYNDSKVEAVNVDINDIVQSSIGTTDENTDIITVRHVTKARWIEALPFHKNISTGAKNINCQLTQSYSSIKDKPNWKKTLHNGFSSLIQNLRTAVETQSIKTRNWDENLNRARILLAAAFKPIISVREFTTMISTFYTLADHLIKADIAFFLYGGSAIGSYRHFGLIPWDDDIDIMISVKDLNRTLHSISTISGYTLVTTIDRQWKFFMSKLHALVNIQHRWPFVDIFFYEENVTHIWDRIPAYKSTFVYPKKWIFPLQYRPFEGGLVPVPCKLKSVLSKNYKTYMCRTSYYFHKYERMRDSSKQAYIHCSLIHDLFPFVFRETLNNSSDYVSDTLKIGQKFITTHAIPSYCMNCD